MKNIMINIYSTFESRVSDVSLTLYFEPDSLNAVRLFPPLINNRHGSNLKRFRLLETILPAIVYKNMLQSNMLNADRHNQNVLKASSETYRPIGYESLRSFSGDVFSAFKGKG